MPDWYLTQNYPDTIDIDDSDDDTPIITKIIQNYTQNKYNNVPIKIEPKTSKTPSKVKLESHKNQGVNVNSPESQASLIPGGAQQPPPPPWRTSSLANPKTTWQFCI